MIVDVTFNIHDIYLKINIPDHLLMDDDGVDDFLLNHFYKNVKIEDLHVQTDW